MNDRRPLLAIGLILLIAVIPGFLIKRPPRPAAADSAAVITDSLLPAPGGAPVPTVMADSATAGVAQAPMVPDDTIVVRSGLYRYAISTRGGRIVSARFLRYRSMNPADTSAAGIRDTVELLPAGGSLLESTLRISNQATPLDATVFTADTDSITVGDRPATLTLTGTAGAAGVALVYTFSPDDYRIRVDARFSNIGANGGTLDVGLGSGFHDTEAAIAENNREKGVVTKREDTDLVRFESLDPRSTRTISGPFEWVAVKSKYFVVGMFAFDSTQAGVIGNIGGVEAEVLDTLKKPVHVGVTSSLTVPSSGVTHWDLYLGPMEYDRLTAMGRDFDDVNPYGWPGFRTIIRPFAVAIRALFVWMHEALSLHYGLVIIAFGIMVRILLWPLNQKAMRSMTAMQAIQPELQALQERYKQDPQRLQQEMFKLYKVHKVNPMGGCWPMLLPYPLLVAVFFVLANTIELRGVEFLWMPDLSRGDPLFITPIAMALSMFALSKLSTMGTPPNPQAKMMMYLMPGMMLVFFLNFASGLNLYYAVQNIAALPQQWLIMRERQRLAAGRNPAVVVGTRKS